MGGTLGTLNPQEVGGLDPARTNADPQRVRRQSSRFTRAVIQFSFLARPLPCRRDVAPCLAKCIEAADGLVAPSDTNTGLLFVTKANVKPYLTTTSRYEGSSKAQKYPVT